MHIIIHAKCTYYINTCKHVQTCVHDVLIKDKITNVPEIHILPVTGAALQAITEESSLYRLT